MREQESFSENFLRQKEEALKVLLVGLDTGADKDFSHSMEELASLAEAADKQVAGVIIQRMGHENKALYIGPGKVAEVREYAGQCGAQEIVFDNALTPSQVRNLGRELELPILDRTNLILDIFAMRARTREARLQVETARLRYLLPRLVGMRENLSRQGGAGGSMSSKGAGETRLELDRRKIQHRISELERELENVARGRETMRKRRSGSLLPQVALVGYTNAGKSTIMNQLVERYGERPEKTVLEKDMLFATLETQVRKILAGDNMPFLLVDTVGFLHRLPHDLVKAFRSTLEEVCRADLLVHVVDFSDEHYREQMKVTEETLKELGAGDIPRIVAYNKIDRCGNQRPRRNGDQVYIAAARDLGLDVLLEAIQEAVYAHSREEVCFLIPYEDGKLVSYFMENATILEREYREEGVWLHVSCHRSDTERYRAYLCAGLCS